MGWADREFETIGNVPPAKAEAAYYRPRTESAMTGGLKQTGLRDSGGGLLPGKPSGAW